MSRASMKYETEGMTWQERCAYYQERGEYVTGTYTLTATRDGQTSTKLLEGCQDDTDATFSGMTYVLNTANFEQGGTIKFWSKGRIELRDPDGELVQVMEEKP